MICQTLARVQSGDFSLMDTDNSDKKLKKKTNYRWRVKNALEKSNMFQIISAKWENERNWL